MSISCVGSSWLRPSRSARSLPTTARNLPTVLQPKTRSPWQACFRCGLRSAACRAPSGAAAPPANQRHGRALQRPHQRVLQQTRVDSRADLQATLMNYSKLYNHHIPQRALDAKTPIPALKECQQKRPELFVKRVFDQTDSTSNYPAQVRIEAGGKNRNQ